MPNQSSSGWACSALKTRIIREGIASFGRRQKCENYSIERSLSRTGYVRSATRSSPIIAMWCPIIKNRRGWAEPGVTTIRTTFRQHTGGATLTKDQRGWTSDGRSVTIHSEYWEFRGWGTDAVCKQCAQTPRHFGFKQPSASIFLNFQFLRSCPYSHRLAGRSFGTTSSFVSTSAKKKPFC